MDVTAQQNQRQRCRARTGAHEAKALAEQLLILYLAAVPRGYPPGEPDSLTARSTRRPGLPPQSPAAEV